MKLLILSRYDGRGASSRIRFLQYIPHLERAGFEVEVASFFDAAYLDSIYSGRAVRFNSLGYFARRLQQILRVRSFDVIWLEKEALPWIPWPVERLLFPASVPIASDFDDAVFHRYDMHSRPSVRRLLGQKIDRVMAHSQMVFAGNDYLAGRARSAGASRVELIPTVIDLNAYPVESKASCDGRLRVGWIGTPETWDKFVSPMQNMIGEVAAEHNAVFRCVGATSSVSSRLHFEFLPWSEEHEVSMIQEMDIGIMPLPDTPWAQGKCGYKLIQYMACGIPVVASPVGVNSRIVEHGVNGFLASNESDWNIAVSTLLANPQLRHEMGAAGRKKVEAEYSVQVYGPRVVQNLLELAESRNRSRSA
ncbi:glycosyltransferase family 4 protein [Hoeflea sp. TYP-13]|uniref:glycosyltransferase family 4 protein n=1 Tax=Hoeflea sp. TYP-13 TaxID=3230023 RepID=UPI0034C5EEBF